MSTIELPATPSVPRLEVIRGTVGFMLLGLAAGAGAESIGAALWAAPIAVATALLPPALTAPALLVVHQFLGRPSRPDEVVGDLTASIGTAGRLAAGLAPIVLFFSLTSGLWFGSLWVSMLAVGGAGLVRAHQRLVERDRGNWPLAIVWILLTALVGLRIAFITGGALLGW